MSCSGCTNYKQSRRRFLRQVGSSALGTAMLHGFRNFGMANAFVQYGSQSSSVSDYKALVCLFLFGGSDGNNVIVPLEDNDYTAYQRVRGPIALPKDQLREVTPPSIGARFGFHFAMAEMQALWKQGKVAALTNVGTLVEPLTRDQYRASPSKRPEALFSHSDQQAQWQMSISRDFGLGVLTGWGGRMADRTGPLNAGNRFPQIISVAGAQLFTKSAESHPLAITPGSTFGLQGFTAASSFPRRDAHRELLQYDNEQTLVHSVSSTTEAAIANSATLTQVLTGASPLQTRFPNTGLASQLSQIARIIQAREKLGMKRQLFFCSLGGFDTHGDQLFQQANLLTQLSQAMNAFYSATVELGVADQVTTFTLSDFGRTYKPSASGGSDHAWGSHHFIMGDAVRGGDFYGKLPTLALGGPDDASDNSTGRWIPTTSVDQYGATLARWYGLAESDLPAVFPNIGRFPTSNLGFLG